MNVVKVTSKTESDRLKIHPQRYKEVIFMTTSFQKLRTFTLPMGFRGRNAVVVQLWWVVQALLFHPSPQFLYGWRRFLLRLFGAQIGADVLIRPSARVTYPWKLEIGDHSQIGDGVELYSLGQITIGKNTVISQDCYICTGGHDPAREDFAIYQQPVIIEDEVWLAAQCFVMPGVTVRRGSFCKVRSLVTQDTCEGAIYAGSPARKTGDRRDLSPLMIDEKGARHDA